MKHWYENCIGILFCTDEMIEEEEDSIILDEDKYIGQFSTEKEAEQALDEMYEQEEEY